MGFGFGMGFDMFSIMFTIVFVLVIGTFIVTAVKGIGQWNKNNNSPRLTVPATVVSKRTNVTATITVELMVITIITPPLHIMLHSKSKAEIAWSFMWPVTNMGYS